MLGLCEPLREYFLLNVMYFCLCKTIIFLQTSFIIPLPYKKCYLTFSSLYVYLFKIKLFFFISGAHTVSTNEYINKENNEKYMRLKSHLLGDSAAFYCNAEILKYSICKLQSLFTVYFFYVQKSLRSWGGQCREPGRYFADVGQGEGLRVHCLSVYVVKVKKANGTGVQQYNVQFLIPALQA